MTNLTRWIRLLLGAAGALATGCGNPQFASEPGPDAGPPPPMPLMMIDAGPPPPPMTNCDAVQSGAMSAALQGRQAVEAPGMKAEGQAICGVVSEGNVVSSPTFMLEPGYCYTFLGEGLPPVAEVDMHLQIDATGMVLLPPLNAMAAQPLMVDTMQGLHAGMGMKNTCYQSGFMIPAPVKLHVKSSKGGPGPVAAQVFRKKL